MKSAFLALLIVCLLSTVAAHADILYLEGGGRIEGVVSGGPIFYTVRSVHGTTKVPAARVTRRVKQPYVTEVFESKRRRTNDSDPDAVYLLSRWCEREGLRKQARYLLEEVLVLDPDHARTRALLGQVKYDGVWMKPEEARDARLVKEGFVRYEGRWFTPAGLMAYVRARQETARLEEEMARKRALRDEKERKKREALEKKKREEEFLRQAEEDRRERARLQRERDELVDLLRAMHLRDSWYGGSRTWGWSGYGIGRRYCGPGAVPYGFTPYGHGSGRLARPGGATFRYTQGKLPIGRVSRPARER